MTQAILPRVFGADKLVCATEQEACTPSDCARARDAAHDQCARRGSIRRNPTATSTIMRAWFRRKLRIGLTKSSRNLSGNFRSGRGRGFPENAKRFRRRGLHPARCAGVGRRPKQATQWGCALCFHSGSQNVSSRSVTVSRARYRTRRHSTSPSGTSNRLP